MKKIGLVGGVAWRSTVDYYAGICLRSEREHAARGQPGPAATPEMTIESLDIRTAIGCLGVDGNEGSWSRFDEYHRSALTRLAAAGVNVAIIASNTPHRRFEAITRDVGVPVIDLFGEAAAECARLGAMQALILGTAATMSSQRIRERFAHHGIDAYRPADEATRSLTEALIADLQFGADDHAEERLTRIVEISLRQSPTARSVVCLACTELPSAIPRTKTQPSFELNGVLFVNTTAVHIDAVYRFSASG